MTGDLPAPGRPSLLGRAAAVLAVVAALAVAAAVVGQPSDRARTLPADLPWPAVVLGADALTGAALAAGVLLAVAAAWALATAPRRREFRHRPWWHTPLALGILGVVTLVLAWLVRRGFLGDPLAELARLQERVGAGAGDVEPGAPAQGTRVVAEALRQGAVVAGALLVVGLALVLRARWRRAGEDGGQPEGVSERAGARLSAAVDAALDDLDAGGDPRAAILRCYAHLDAALAAAGCARRRAETAREHRHRAAATLGPAAQAAARLVDRFERARYDAAPVGETDRREAVAALHEVRAALAAAGAAAGAGGLATRRGPG